MQHAHKVTLTPFNESGPAQSVSTPAEIPQSDTPQMQQVKSIINSKKRNRGRDIQGRIYRIILKLAKVNGYDEDNRILSRNGNFIEKSNVIELIRYCMSA